MNIFAFTTSDITPEQWSTFTKATAVPPQTPDKKPIIPYVLIHTPSQEDLTSPTTSLAKPITTSFKSTPWPEIKDCFRKLSDPVDNEIHTQFFLILDAQSHQDRKVTIVQRDLEYVTPEGRVLPNDPVTMQDVKKMWVWKRHRVPFEETWETCALLDVHGGLEEEKWVEEVVKELAEEEE